MKRLWISLFALLMTVVLTGCGGQREKEDGEVKVLPKPPQQALAVQSIEQLHGGLVQDISPDGKTLLFSWNMGQPDPNLNDEMAPVNLLHELNLSSGKVEKISHSEIHQGSARYAPDGKNIAFLENVETFFQAYVMENRPNAPKKLIHKSDEIANSITWSPDGQKFAVNYFLINKGQVILYDAKGNEMQSLPQPKGIALFPQFYDQDTLLYVSVNHEANTSKIVAQDVMDKGQNPREVVAGTNFEVSPNKRSIAYLSTNTDRSQWKIQVSAIDSDLKVGSTRAEVTIKDSSSLIAWSPDSRHLLYSEEGNIWAINVENGDKKQLATDMGRIQQLLWAGEKEIIFTGITKEAEQNGDYDFNMYRIQLK